MGIGAAGGAGIDGRQRLDTNGKASGMNVRPATASGHRTRGQQVPTLRLLIRLRQVAVLLRQTADSVLSVALNLGFQSETHFGKAFKKQYGISPGQYRKNEAANTAALPLSYDI